MSLIQSIADPLFQRNKVWVSVKRDDQIHPVISGNKYFKLHYHLEAFADGDYTYLASFGGAYSNHLHALAYAGQQLGIPTIGFIRGEQIIPLNPTLQDCVRWGMTLIPLSRQEYKLKQQSALVRSCLAFFPKMYLVPEGGSGVLGVRGAMKMLPTEMAQEYDRIIVAAGTGTTAAGIIASAPVSTKVNVIAVLKAGQWLQQEITDYLNILGVERDQWNVSEDYVFGGYAKRPKELLSFIESQKQMMPLEPVYTGKAWFALHHMIEIGEILPRERVLFIHTGGLQGYR